MSLEKNTINALKTAMKSKDQIALAALRAIKSELLLAKTSGMSTELSETDEIKILQKLVKQRKDSASIFLEQNRKDLAEPEIAQAKVISQFLPTQLSKEEVTNIVDAVVVQIGASSMKDMGKVMSIVNEKLAGQADGKTISGIVKERLLN